MRRRCAGRRLLERVLRALVGLLGRLVERLVERPVALLVVEAEACARAAGSGAHNGGRHAFEEIQIGGWRGDGRSQVGVPLLQEARRDGHRAAELGGKGAGGGSLQRRRGAGPPVEAGGGQGGRGGGGGRHARVSSLVQTSDGRSKGLRRHPRPTSSGQQRR